MEKKTDKKKITITEEQASQAAETILNAWLRCYDDGTTYIKDNEKNNYSK